MKTRLARHAREAAVAVSRFALLLSCLAVAGAVIGAEATPENGNPRTAYFTTGDNQDLLGLPLDSRATIAATFDVLHDGYRVSRIWWRGGQDEIWGNQFVIRPENREFFRIWQWWKHLQYEGVGTNRIAVEEAHARGMQLWMAYGLFDNGSQADAGYVGFPYAVEDRLRVEHPEWAPLNRYGTWRQGGPLEFCYPEARAAMVGYLTHYLVAGGYDGVAFLTYAENFSQRYEDEFGYNQPLVEEFQRRHGVDIRSQDFDKQAWSRLRGEYLTQFLRELRAALAPHDKKIAVCVDGENPHLPCRWNFPGSYRTAGNVYLDLERWADEGIVDEINVYAPNTEQAINQCVEICRGKPAQCSVFRTRGPMPPGAPRIMFLGPDIESGFDWEHYIDYPDENVPPQPAEALSRGDVYARRRVLTAIIKGKQTLPASEVTAATRDPDVFVRRAALRALGKMGDPASIAAVKEALCDVENSVRWQAALVLGELAGADCVDALLEAVGRPESTFQFNFRAVPHVLRKLQEEGNLSSRDKERLAAKINDPDTGLREFSLYCLRMVGAPATPEIEAALHRAVLDDPEPYVRELALVNLRSSFGPTPAVLATVRRALADQDAAVQVRAAGALALMFGPADAPAEARAQALADLEALWRQYGDVCRRADAEWGWREVGQALLGMGPQGDQILRESLAQRSDRRLADLAWRALYLKQGDGFFRITEQDDAEAHAQYPFPSGTP